MPTRPAALLAVLVLATAAAASDPIVGPPLGNTTYRGDITSGPQGVDTDSFAGPLLAGERLRVSVLSKFQSPLFPRLEVTRPDGSVPTFDARVRRGGKLIDARSILCDRTGTWRVDVTNLAGSQGNYTLSTRVKPMPTMSLPPIALGGAAPATTTIELPGMALARLDVSVTFAKSDAPVRFYALTDPDGAEVLQDGAPLVATATSSKRSVRLRKSVLSGGLGMYRLTLGVDSGSATASIRYRVVPTERPRTTGVAKLASAEPYLVPLAVPLRGVSSLSVKIDGLNFSFPTPPRVLFDGAAGTIEERDDFGTTMRVIPPEGVDGATVAVTIVNPDGQAFTREDYFHYVAPPTITGVFDADGAPMLGGSTTGGQVARLTGTEFQPGVRVRFGNASVSTLVLADDLLEVIVPPHPKGQVSVAAFDVFDHEAFAPTGFTY
jgi:hypothetical protein